MPNSDSLMLVEDSERGIVVPGLIEQEIDTPEELFSFLIAGNSRRVKASTSFNSVSSRSHALIILSVEKK